MNDIEMSHLTIKELQSIGYTGNIHALAELGRRVLDKILHDDVGNDYFCEAEFELNELKLALDNELPPECPHCGKLIGDI